MFLNRWRVTFIISIKLRDVNDWRCILWIFTGNVYSYSDGRGIQCGKSGIYNNGSGMYDMWKLFWTVDFADLIEWSIENVIW